MYLHVIYEKPGHVWIAVFELIFIWSTTQHVDINMVNTITILKVITIHLFLYRPVPKHYSKIKYYNFECCTPNTVLLPSFNMKRCILNTIYQFTEPNHVPYMDLLSLSNTCARAYDYPNNCLIVFFFVLYKHHLKLSLTLFTNAHSSILH